MTASLHDREQRKTERRLLFCRLTSDEQIQRGEALATLTQEIAALEDAQAAENKRMKEALDGMYDAQRALACVVVDGQEERPVDCEKTYDYDALQVRVVRTDTGELLEARAMTHDECQIGLPMDLPAARAMQH